MHEKTVLAIIPARGGSKRVPKKNIYPVAGKPLISWSIEAALKANYVTDIVVTSDDSDILRIARRFQNIECLERPDYLSTDTATTIDVLKHTLEYKNREYDYIILLQPTSPLRTSLHIDEAILMAYSKNADAIISVTKPAHSPLWCNTIPENGDMSNFLSNNVKNTRSQDLPEYYTLNGSIFIAKPASLLRAMTFFLSSNVYSYFMKPTDSIDIDTMEDMEYADYLLRKRKQDNVDL